jgi:phage tail sheath protein FI
MSVATFPGVFIQEVPSGVRTITGVPTAITAFVGRTAMGPLTTPVVINSFGDFTRLFGGLNANSSVSYAVRDFFLNGGGQAVIVRLFPAADVSGHTSTITLGTSPNQLVLAAANPGAWGAGLSVKVTQDLTGTDLTNTALALGLPASSAANIFTVTVTLAGGPTETIRNVTTQPSSRTIGPTLKTESQLVVAQTVPGSAFIDASSLVGTATATSVDDDLGTSLGTTDYDAGFTALTRADVVNIVCVPPEIPRSAADSSWGDTNQAVFTNALNNFCVPHRAMLIVDPLSTWTTVAQVVAGFNTAFPGITGNAARNAVMYFPRVLEADTVLANRTVTTVSCGIVAGIMAATDATRGVWKAPAGIDAGIAGTLGLALNMTDQENGQINPIGINALRTFPVIGSVVWGARTLRGADVLADDYKYLPGRRFALFLEESLVRGLKFAVFEPNDEPLWAQIRLAVGAFLNNLFRQGAFQGRTPAEAYFVKADNETTTQNDINLGIVNVLVGFAPLKPAEFVIIKLQQIAGQIST